jgi:hypothetical protein
MYRNQYTRHLPHKLAEFLGENFADQIDVKKIGGKWSVKGLNRILRRHVAARRKGFGKGRHLHTFHVIEWEHETCEGIARARCCPFRKFKGKDVQVRVTINLSHVIFYAI